MRRSPAGQVVMWSMHLAVTLSRKPLGDIQRYVWARQTPAGAATDAGAAATVNKLLCDGDCLANLDALETHETKSGLKYKDIVVGKGPSPPTGYQAGSAAHAAT